jgi:hypothetical protein
MLECMLPIKAVASLQQSTIAAQNPAPSDFHFCKRINVNHSLLVPDFLIMIPQMQPHALEDRRKGETAFDEVRFGGTRNAIQ